jgi:hypothetical protein
MKKLILWSLGKLVYQGLRRQLCLKTDFLSRFFLPRQDLALITWREKLEKLPEIFTLIAKIWLLWRGEK